MQINPHRGYVYDTETGLYYLQSRYYDPITGRFLNADIYIDTNTGTPLSTNMFAYCENNAVMRYDVTGKDAWWIQSPSSVRIAGFYQAGHTSLLIQEKPGFWWYFYWGDKSIQLLFLGTTTQKDIDNKIRRFINMYNHIFSRVKLNLKYDEKYTKSIRLSGDFYPAFRYILNLLYIHAHKNDSKYGLRFDPTCTTNPKKVNLTSDRHKYYKYNKKKYDRPFSWIIKGNKDYNVFSKNCLDMSAGVLAQGSLKKNNKNFGSNMMYLVDNYTVPNKAYEKMLDYNYGKEVIT